VTGPYTLQMPVSQEELHQYIEQFPFSIAVFDAQGRVTLGNREFAACLEYSAHELEQLRLEDLVPNLQCGLKDLLNAQVPGQLMPVYNLRSKSGRQMKSRVNIFRLKSDKIDGDYVISMFPDLVATSSDNLLQRFSGTFLRDVNLGVILINPDFRLVDLSDMACKVLGVKRDDILNKPLDEVFASVPKEYQLVQRTLLDGLTVRNHAISWTNDRERYELLMDSNLLLDEFGRTVGAYVIFKDVTNLRSLEEQVQRSDRLAMIGQVAAGTAHEIRNPLTSIKGFLQVLKKTLLDNGFQREHEYTEIMLAEINRINELVSELLMLSKPKEYMFRKVDVSAVIGEILPIINNEAILNDVVVQYITEKSLPPVIADPELLKQVFLNISKNGIEAMTEGGILTISESLDTREMRVNIDIRDTGPGIPTFLIDKIFDPFFTTKEKGTGLGLSVCQRIIHDIHGTIRVSSKGYGTTFTISIPVAK